MGHHEPAYDANNPILRDGQPVEEIEYLTDALTREAVDFIARHRTRPFFLCLSYNAVHSPLQAAEAYMQRFGEIDDIHRRIFAAMLSNLDDSVGEVLEALRQADLEENTLVFFLSDNGGPTRELTSSNAPLRGGKGSVYEGGIRVPLLVQWKGTLPRGTLYQQPVISLDIFATAIKAAGLKLEQKRQLDGVDLLPHLTGRATEPPHRELFWRMRGRRALRIGDWKLLKQPGYGQSEASWELYCLAEDIDESQNLADREPERLAAMIARWNELNMEMKPPFWDPADSPR